MFNFLRKKEPDYLERAETEAERRSERWTSSSADVYSDFWYGPANHEPISGVNVSEQSAMKFSTLASCVTLIAGDVARLPLILYRRLSGGAKERLASHPKYDLVHDAPNDELCSFSWREAATGHLALWGNHYCDIVSNDYTGRIKSLVPITSPGAVQIERNDAGKLTYRWRDYKGREHVRLKNQILHIPGFGFDGIKGLSPIAMAREAVGHGMAVQEFGTRYFTKGTHPSAVVSLPVEFGGLGDQEEAYLKKMKSDYSGLGKSHNLMVLPNGETFTSISVPMEDAQFIESKVASRTEICGFYRVPPHKVGIHSANSNRNNTEQENQSYIDSCLIHYLSRFERQLTMQLLTQAERKDGLFFEFKVDGLLRGDSVARSQYYNKIWQVGGISVNEIRGMENMNPVDGGDQLFVPLNFVPMGMAGEIHKQRAGVSGTKKGKGDTAK